ncbi:MAG: hypothetical protein ACRDWD_05120 [Acidimicrobiia bacterium]
MIVSAPAQVHERRVFLAESRDFHDAELRALQRAPRAAYENTLVTR